MQITDAHVVLTVLGCLALVVLWSVHYDLTQPRITHLLSVDWYGYVNNDPTYGVTIEIQRRRLFRAPLVSRESITVLSPSFRALRNVKTSDKIPGWLSEQIVRSVANRDIRKLPQHEVIRRITDARMSLDQDPALHP